MKYRVLALSVILLASMLWAACPLDDPAFIVKFDFAPKTITTPHSGDAECDDGSCTDLEVTIAWQRESSEVYWMPDYSDLCVDENTYPCCTGPGEGTGCLDGTARANICEMTIKIDLPDLASSGFEMYPDWIDGECDNEASWVTHYDSSLQLSRAYCGYLIYNHEGNDEIVIGISALSLGTPPTREPLGLPFDMDTVAFTIPLRATLDTPLGNYMFPYPYNSASTRSVKLVRCDPESDIVDSNATHDIWFGADTLTVAQGNFAYIESNAPALGIDDTGDFSYAIDYDDDWSGADEADNICLIEFTHTYPDLDLDWGIYESPGTPTEIDCNWVAGWAQEGNHTCKLKDLDTTARTVTLEVVTDEPMTLYPYGVATVAKVTLGTGDNAEGIYPYEAVSLRMETCDDPPVELEDMKPAGGAIWIDW